MLRVVLALVLGPWLLATGGCTAVAPIPKAETLPTERVGAPGFADYTPAQFAEALLKETNRVRVANGCQALRRRLPLDAAADDQASMTSLRFTAVHTSPLPGQATPGDRVRRHGVQAALCAENVAAIPLGQGSQEFSAAEIAAQLVTAWMASPGHRANLLNPDMTELGGSVRIVRGPSHVWYAFGVQVFVRPEK